MAKFVTTQGLVRSEPVFEANGKTPVKAMVKHNGRERMIDVYEHHTHNANETIELTDKDEIEELLDKKLIRPFDEVIDGGEDVKDVVARKLAEESDDPLK